MAMRESSTETTPSETCGGESTTNLILATRITTPIQTATGTYPLALPGQGQFPITKRATGPVRSVASPQMALAHGSTRTVKAGRAGAMAGQAPRADLISSEQPWCSGTAACTVVTPQVQPRS